jgi:hypothetical protein
MRRILAIAAGAAAIAGIGAGPALAHVVSVTPPSGTSVEGRGWAGSFGLPGSGQGLIPGGPTGTWLISPSHERGLNTACETIRSSGKAAVDISGPGGPGCPHGA